MNNQKKRSLVNLTKAGIVAALYAVLTLALSPISYGAMQIRLSEIFNNLAVFNKRYIWALTIGCAIANLNSPLGIVDIVFGSLGTLLMTSLSYFLSRRVKSSRQACDCSGCMYVDDLDGSIRTTFRKSPSVLANVLSGCSR